MPVLSQSVPVTLADSWGGLASNRGILRLEGSSLVLEFETKDGVLQVLRSAPRQVAIPVSELEACRYRAGWFSTSIDLEVHRLEILRDAPGAESGKLSLEVARSDRTRASSLVDTVNCLLAQQFVRSVEDAASPRLNGHRPQT